MPRKYIFADEAGCFEFSRKQNVSSYFILCTVTMDGCNVGADLLSLRRRLAWEKFSLGEYFHATTDQQAVRDQVFGLICHYDFTIQATIMEKAKAQPHIREAKPKFYKYGWYYHFRYGIPKSSSDEAELLTTAASIGTRKERDAFASAVDDVMEQTVKAPTKWVTNFCPAAADPCIQVADYCAWALQRKWERKDMRSYDLIKDKISYEYDLWQKGAKLYY